ncbi:1,4-dihydroxy-2-naphthoate polyprenyltransferase [Rhodovibrio sodomensis]|uniref:1,4-dihydroxy-2-naphthoate octaprenyltransferase n=1 Tax=Rhodovibrio sodomensis TaxID=1088 RepID=A0ABS1DB94_9PROT|nr:1,4-dihydroxy-2-naphthoate polyprenyltransferase [Rhodovibrio sodomensis]MBK1667719.1 1,4-dihydroxy-2-naphthoate polyprenyltransferase [Rhodovibrio sodomensis]
MSDPASPHQAADAGRAQTVSRLRAWLMAARPQTLPAGASPVIVGTGAALGTGVFHAGAAVAALLGALLIQIGTNFANDYYDAIKGADTDSRVGFRRVTSGGLIDGRTVYRAMWATFAGAVAVGCYLVWLGGLPVVAVGLGSIAAGIAYTGGPAYGYKGLGDPFVFVFFGLVAVNGTVYVQAAAPLSPLPAGLPAGTLSWHALVASLPAAGLTTCMLVINNIRDADGDRDAGKRTLVVRFGRPAARVEFLGLLALAYGVPAVMAVADGAWPRLLPLATLPLAAAVVRTLYTTTDGPTLNRTLARCGKLMLVHSLLFAAGLAVS